PLIAAITGFSKISILFSIVCTELAYFSASIGLIFTTYLISAPAQNDLSPLPVMITTFILSSAETVSIAEDSSVITSTLIAFSTSGLLIVIIAMSSGRRSICI